MQNTKENKAFFKEPKVKPKKAKLEGCEKCKLYLTCTSPKMKYTGKGKLPILIIDEFPTETDDKKGVQLVGEGGQLLRQMVRELGYSLSDFYKTTAIKCMTNKPTAMRINLCREKLLGEITTLKPKVIIPLGKTSLQSLLGHRLTQTRVGLGSVVDWAGLSIPDQELGCYICPTWNPTACIRTTKYGTKTDSVLYEQIKNALKGAIDLSGQAFYQGGYEDSCFPIYDESEAIGKIKECQNKGIIAFDYETTGLKPHKEGHKIYSISISDGMFSFSFPYFNSKKFRKVWLEFLQSDVKKLCHNGKFENLWSMVRGGYNDTEGCSINNLYWDTMLGGHSLYNNKKNSLKYCAYIHLGILGYDTEIDPYLEASKEDEELYGGNAFNRIHEAPLDKVLKYNAMDSILTFKVYEAQTNLLDDTLKKGVYFFTKCSLALSDVENNGFCYDEKVAKEIEKELKGKMDALEQEVLSMKELKKWDKDIPFRMSAPGDITHVLFNLMKYKCKDENRTEKSNRPKSDVDTLSTYNIPIVQKVLEWRKIQKKHATYIKGVLRESCNGKIHAFYNLHTVPTFRSSANSPSMHNQPKHDKESLDLVRKSFMPSKGNKLVEYDYGAQEFRINTCVTKDPNMIKYVTSGKDPHRGYASKIYLMPVDEVMNNKGVSKDVRYVTKNGFIFPTIYGSYYKNTGVDLYNNVTDETREYLKTKGFTNVDKFITHVKKIEDDFWEEFSTAHVYKEKMIKKYNDNGYIVSITGFKYNCPLTINQLLNYPIQGSAFHCLLWTLEKVNTYIKKHGLKSKIIGEIHDSLIVDMVPGEEEKIDYIVWWYGTQKIREVWKWIIVPLVIEKSSSEIDGDWSKMGNEEILDYE